MNAPFAFPPFRMKKDAAAFYCGMSLTSFDRAVDGGELPEGKCGTGGRYWLRQDLEAAMLDRKTTKHNFGARI